MSTEGDALAFGPQLRELLEGWFAALLGRSPNDPLVDFAENLTMWLLVSVIILVGLLLAMLYSTWIERKFVGRIQDRIGPNRVGRFGLLQPFADMIKILTKEDITPEPAHRWVFNLGSLLVVPPALIIFAVVPFGIGLVASELSVGLLFFLAVSSMMVLPIFMAGWGSRNKYSAIGAMRAVAQIISYEIPQLLSIVGIVLLAGSLSLQHLTLSQGPITPEGGPTFPGVWYALLQPVAFIIFLLATAAEIERTPFDLPEAESEIIAGYHVEYSGIKFGMFYLGVYFATIAAAALGTVLFLGGWQPPLSALAFIPGPFWFAGKTLLFILLFMWLRGTLPRFRVDQLMSIAWKILVPLALANLMVAGLVGRITYDVQASAPPESFQASPWFVLLGFTLANVLLAVLALALMSWWRGRPTKAAPALLSTGGAEVAG